MTLENKIQILMVVILGCIADSLYVGHSGKQTTYISFHYYADFYQVKKNNPGNTNSMWNNLKMITDRNVVCWLNDPHFEERALKKSKQLYTEQK